jgi:hypothetical protein
LQYRSTEESKSKKNIEMMDLKSLEGRGSLRKIRGKIIGIMIKKKKENPIKHTMFCQERPHWSSPRNARCRIVNSDVTD